MKKVILKIKDLKKSYHTKDGETKAVDSFTFDLEEGKFIAIVGPSGCGKSTILSILAGLEQKSDGEIILEDKKIGYMLQQDSLFNWRTVLDNCLLGLELNKNLDKENKDYVVNLLNTYGLKDFINSYPNQLSGGMRQRVALIRTLATNPDILLLDEAFSALDYQTRLSVCNDVYKIIKSEKKTAILVTHDISEAISLSDRILVLTKRPATLYKEHVLPFNKRLSPLKRREQKEFPILFDVLWRELNDEN